MKKSNDQNWDGDDPARRLTLTTLTLSFVVHLLIFSSVILTFTPKPIPHQPMFVFLGSILPKQDFVTFSLGPSHPPHPSGEKTLTIQERRIRLNSVNHISPAKPNYSAVVQASPQTILKSNFESGDAEPTKSSSLTGTVDFKPYVPLRLETR